MGNDTVEAPTTRLDGPWETMVLNNVTAGPSCWSVLPATTKPLGAQEKVCRAVVNAGIEDNGAGSAGRFTTLACLADGGILPTLDLFS